MTVLDMIDKTIKDSKISADVLFERGSSVNVEIEKLLLETKQPNKNYERSTGPRRHKSSWGHEAG